MISVGIDSSGDCGLSYLWNYVLMECEMMMNRGQCERAYINAMTLSVHWFPVYFGCIPIDAFKCIILFVIY